MSKVYYNEFDRQKAAWLRLLIEEGVIAEGVVDERSIHEVQPGDLKGFAQCHFFAGIGLWSLCFRRAGWADDRPVWSGSCPCGPFSKAGKRGGFEDPRHLWPEWIRLIRECRPDVLFGEQSDEAVDWLDLVQTDMEGSRYAFGSAVLPAAGYGGAHGRHRIGFVADADNAEWWSERAPWHDGGWPKAGRVKGNGHPGDGGQGFSLEHAVGDGRGAGRDDLSRHERILANAAIDPRILGDAGYAGLSDAQLGIVRRPGWTGEGRAAEQSGHSQGTGVDWLLCRDSKWRPVEPGLAPLVDAYPARMALLRGFGDAIDVTTFTQFIAAYMEVAP